MPERSPDAPRLRALGAELVRIHDAIRKDLAALLADVEAARAGAKTTTLPAPNVRTQLFERCRSICATVHAHHANETERGFPLLEERVPGLTPVLDRLRAEHETLAELRRRFEETLDRLDADGEPAERPAEVVSAEVVHAEVVHGELRRLAAELEAHFDREERQLISALNAL
jgi:hypothetical protein